MPISNAEIERTFSIFSFIKNKLKNCLLDEIVNDFNFIYKNKLVRKNFM